MNPFSETLKILDSSTQDEQIIYANARHARQQIQRELLLTKGQFNRDEILAQVERDIIYEDPRHSIIFIARPESIIQGIVDLQCRIVQVFSNSGVPESSLWITPADKLHMTLLDIVSCVPRVTVNDLLPDVNVSTILGRVPVGSQCTLMEPMLMVDGTALALSFLPKREETMDSHVRLRSNLWDGCQQDGTTPAMRYVSMSAHVTLVRFLEDVTLDAEAMVELLDDLQCIVRTGLDKWTITKDDIQCIYGQVYYGGGMNVH